MPRREQRVATFGTSGEPLIATMSVPEGGRDGRLLALGDRSSGSGPDKSSSPDAKARSRTRTKHRARLLSIAVVVFALFILGLLLLLTLSAGRSSIFRALFRDPATSGRARGDGGGGGHAATSDRSAFTPRSAALSASPSGHLRSLDLLVGAQQLPSFLRQPTPLFARRGRLAFLDPAAHSLLVSDPSVTINECRIAVGERAEEPLGQRGGTLYPKVFMYLYLLLLVLLTRINIV